MPKSTSLTAPMVKFRDANRMLCFYVAPETKEQLNMFAANNFTDMSKVLRQAISEFLARKDV